MKKVIMVLLFIFSSTTVTNLFANEIDYNKLYKSQKGKYEIQSDIDQNFEMTKDALDQCVKNDKKISEELDRLKGNIGIPVGTIISSMIDPEKIKKYYGNSWVLANGENVPVNSKYAEIMGVTSLPDLRGMFLRGMNAGRNDGREDPEKGRRIGGSQEDSIRKHSHKTYQSAANSHPDGGTFAFGGAPPNRTINIASDDFGSHETRPKNVAVYYYIKIN